MKFYCANQNCKNYNIEVPVLKVKYDSASKSVVPSDTENVCTECGSILQMSGGSVHSFGLATFSSKSDAEKKKILKERASRSFKEVGRDEKEYRKRKLIKEMTPWND